MLLPCAAAKALPNVKVGTQVTAKVTKIEAYGMFMSLGEGTRDGLLHASEMGIEREDTVAAAGYNIGDDVKVVFWCVSQSKSMFCILQHASRPML